MHRLRAQVAALQRRIRAEAPTVEGLPRAALTVLAAVVRRPGITPRDVATELHMTSSNVAAALRDLEAGGLVGDLAGEERYMESGNIVASNAKLFAALLKLLHKQ